MTEFADFVVADCVVCSDVGCEFCGQQPVPFPTETWSVFSVTDLEQLARDVQTELERRAGMATN